MKARLAAFLLGVCCAQAQAAGVHFSSADRTITVETGTDITLTTLATIVPPELLRQVDAQRHVWLLSAQLMIGSGTRLNLHGSPIGGDVNELRMQSDNVPGPHAFASITADYGTIDIRSTRVTSWDTARNGPDEEYADYGRAFIRARSRLRGQVFKPLQSRMDIVDSDIRNLGYGANESYGLVWKVVAPEPYLYDQVQVFGDVLRSKIHGNYLGLYSSGLRDAQWRGNQVWGSAEYGMAPHNHSNGLTIEGNSVHDNGSHGITLRQDCRHILVRNNLVWGNGDSGIALHRRVFDSVVSGNTISKNRDSGITLYEVSRIAVRDNHVRGNGIAGIQVLMNTTSSRIEANEVAGNLLYGVFVGRGKGRDSGDGLPRGNAIVDNRVYGSGEEEVRTGLVELNRFERNGATTRVEAPEAPGVPEASRESYP